MRSRCSNTKNGEHFTSLWLPSEGDPHHNRERANAIKAMGKMKMENAVAQLLGMLRDQRPEHRVSAMWVLRQIGWWKLLNEVGRIAKQDPDAAAKHASALGVSCATSPRSPRHKEPRPHHRSERQDDHAPPDAHARGRYLHVLASAVLARCSPRRLQEEVFQAFTERLQHAGDPRKFIAVLCAIVGGATLIAINAQQPARSGRLSPKF